MGSWITWSATHSRVKRRFSVVKAPEALQGDAPIEQRFGIIRSAGQDSVGIDLCLGRPIKIKQHRRPGIAGGVADRVDAHRPVSSPPCWFQSVQAPQHHRRVDAGATETRIQENGSPKRAGGPS